MPRSEDDKRAELGRAAETLVADHLVAQRFAIVGRNVRLGRLEIDIIARRGNLIVFCEVRARTHDRFVAPAATIDARKIARLRRAASEWLKLNRLARSDVRLDAAAVLFDTPGGRIEYYEGAY
ncbi:MAG TPA: YraN family protein [Polyangiales bacterium]